MTTASQLEAILLVTDKPLQIAEIAKFLEIDFKAVETALNALRKEYAEQKRGIRILTTGQKMELVTAPECAALVEKVVSHRKKEITSAKIETLTILAYRGPLTKEELEMCRGVNCSLILKNLFIEELVDEIKENQLTVYYVSTKFLKGLGITSVTELPEYEKLKNNESALTK